MNSPGLSGGVSATAARVDAVFLFILGIALFFFLLTQGLLVYFAVRYRRRRAAEGEPETPQITGNRVLEIVWILVPTVVVMAVFAYGYVAFRDIHARIPGAVEIQVTARQWMWEFRYPDGRTAINEVRAPVGRPVRFVMTSADVIHSFFLPDFRVKQDVLPGRYTSLDILPEKTGSYVIHCAEYCGAGHSKMDATFVVMSQADYASWGAARTAASSKPPAERGEEIVKTSGCLNCHALSGAEKIGPNLGGVFGRKVSLEGGGSVAADENYVRESLYDPGAKIVKGYPNVMPTFKGTLPEDDVSAILAYLKTLTGKGERDAGERHGEDREREKR